MYRICSENMAEKNGVSGFSYMVRRYPVKAVKTGNWCLTVCQGVRTLSTDIFGCCTTYCWLVLLGVFFFFFQLL